jgi:signal transduction histidine kinase
MDINTVELFQKVVESLPLGFVMYDRDHKVLVVNKKTEELSGVSRSELVGETLSVKDKQGTKLWFLTQIIFPSIAPKMTHVSDAGEYPQVVRISFDDPRLELQTTTLELTDPDNNPVGYVKLIDDKTQEALVMESKHKFVSLVSHQLRTPLTAVNWTFQILLKENLTESQREIMLTGARAAAELVARIDDTVEVAKIEDKRADYKFATVNLVSLLGEVIERERLLASQHNTAIAGDWDDKQITVTADKHKLGVALANLIDNAVKYGSNSGGETITVGAKINPEKSAIEISIVDSGIGIADSDKEKLFDKFFRADNARRVQPDGNGLGLFIAKNIIESHGGEIKIESKLNQGSTFSVLLPTDPNKIPTLKTNK